MGKRGPAPTSETDPLTSIGIKVPMSMKARLVRLVNNRKAADPSLPLNYGLSEYIRELLGSHLASLAAEQPPAPDAEAGKPRRAATGRRSK